MKIAHVGWGHYPAHRTAGPIIYLHTLALAQARAGDEVTIVCASDRTIPDAPPYATQTEVVEGITYVHLCNRPANLHEPWNPLREAHDPQCEQAFDEVFAELRPDVVHVHNYVGLSFDIVKAARKHAQAVLSSLHNYLPVCSRDDLFFADAELCAGPLERSCSRCLGTLVDDADYRTRHSAGVRALNDCDLVLAVSERVKEIYAEQGVDTNKLVVDRCGTPAGERLWRRVGSKRVAQAAAHAEPPLDGRPLKLVFFGAGLPRKGAMVLLQAIRALKNPERVEVHIYGGVAPADMDRLNGFFNASDPRVREAIHMGGAFTQDDLDGILAAADAAVLTPRWEDNGPQTVFEALSAGLPVLATRVGGIPDVVHDGVNGFLVAEGHAKGLAAAIERLLDEPGLLAELRAGIEPPTRVREHARALRVFYARCLGRPEEQQPPLLYSCSTTEEVAAAVAGAIQDGGRQGVRIETSTPEAEAAAGCLRGDLRINPARIAAQPAQPSELTKSGWLARWPEDEDALSGALALAAIYPDLLAGLEIGVAGDVAQAAAATLERLGAEGIDHENLPDMLIRPVTDTDTRALSELPAQLASARTDELWIGDDHATGAASGLLALGGAGTQRVALIGDELERVSELAGAGTLTLVTDVPLIEQVARALDITAISRDESAQHIGQADVIAVDGRRPEDLWLARAAGRNGTVVIAHGTRHTAASLRAFGLAPTAVDEPSGTVLASSLI